MKEAWRGVKAGNGRDCRKGMKKKMRRAGTGMKQLKGEKIMNSIKGKMREVSGENYMQREEEKDGNGRKRAGGRIN